jgi:hypothetical protein
MKNFTGILVLLSLSVWGCGPSQTSAERDQDQIAAQFKANKAYYDPFEGVFTGTVTKYTGNTSEVSLYLGSQTILANNPGRLEQTPTPTLQGSLNYCEDSKPCFVDKPDDYTGNISQIIIVSANYLPTEHSMILNSAANTSATSSCSGSAAESCAPYTITLKWAVLGKTLVGNITQGVAPVGTITVNRR